MIVLDASAAADFLLDAGPRGRWATEQIASAPRLHAPHLIDWEVAAVVRRRFLLREISRARGGRALADLFDLRIERYAGTPLLDRIWELVDVMTPYDAAYVALAEALDFPLVTTDERLARSHGHEAEVLVPTA